MMNKYEKQVARAEGRILEAAIKFVEIVDDESKVTRDAIEARLQAAGMRGSLEAWYALRKAKEDFAKLWAEG
jgi:hypothetical protein